MPCPNCDHTMRNLGGYGIKGFWCPRCGTLNFEGHSEAHETPSLVERCRDFADTVELDPVAEMLWHKLGIAESINTPENRQ